MSFRGAVAMLVTCCVLGAGLLTLSWRSGVEGERRQAAPECAQSQVFTRAKCRAEVDGTFTSLTRDRVEVDVDGHHLVMDTVSMREVPPLTGRTARVTLYRGVPIHIEGDHLSINAEDSPADGRYFFGFFGVFCCFAGMLNFLVALSVRRHHG